MEPSTLLFILLGCGLALAVFAHVIIHSISALHAAKMERDAKRTEQVLAKADHDLVGALVAYLRLREPDFPINKDSCMQISRHEKYGWPRIIVDMGTWGRTTPIHPPAAVQDLLLAIYQGSLEASLGKEKAGRILATKDLHRRPRLRELSRHDLVKYHPLATRLDACHRTADLRSPYGATGFGYQR